MLMRFHVSIKRVRPALRLARESHSRKLLCGAEHVTSSRRLAHTSRGRRVPGLTVLSALYLRGHVMREEERVRDLKPRRLSDAPYVT